MHRKVNIKKITGLKMKIYIIIMVFVALVFAIGFVYKTTQSQNERIKKLEKIVLHQMALGLKPCPLPDGAGAASGEIGTDADLPLGHKLMDHQTSAVFQKACESNKRISDLNELKNLKKYISMMEGNLNAIPRMLKTLNFEIEVQEHMLFTELGKEIYLAEK
jgi:hypothetical protein